MKQILKKINLTVIIISLLTFIVGWQLGHRDLANKQRNGYSPFPKSSGATFDRKSIDFKLFWDTWDLVSKEYVDKKAIDPQKMYYGAIKGMVDAIGDPYTVFLPPEQQKTTREELGGSFEGVGIQLGFSKEKRLVVIAPLDGTPADKAGIRAGDYILKINDKDATGLSLPDAVNQIRGPKGSKVNLEIFREGFEKPKAYSLQRDMIVVKSAEYSLKTTPQGKKIGVLKLSKFGERTNAEWNKAVSQLLSQNPDAMILDLRNNPGGFLDSAVFIGSEFVEKGNIVIQEDASGQRKEYKVNRTGKLLTVPLAVLINKGSASASEIVAGAIQDYKRGKLIGEKSFGKGTIQQSEELPGNTGIHITTAKWLTPNNRWIHNTGLTPDLAVEEPVVDITSKDKPKDIVMDKALELFDTK